MMRWLWLVLGVTTVLTVAANWGEAGATLSTLTSFKVAGLLAAFGVSAAYTLNLGEFQASVFQASGLRAGRPRFILLSTASHFVNLVSKTSGLGGLALYLREAGRTGQSPSLVTAAYLVAYALGYAAYLVVLVASLAALYLHGSLSPTLGMAAIALFSIVGVVCAVAAFAMSRIRRLEMVASLAASAVNRVGKTLLRRRLLDPERVRSSAAELRESLGIVLGHPAAFARSMAHALGVELLSAASLYVVARSLGVHIGFDVALAGYAVALLFSILSLTPAGIGFVEVSLTLFLVSFHVPEASALAVTVAYRAFDFWLPLLLGALSLLLIRKKEEAVVHA